jgi:hypothetical protein
MYQGNICLTTRDTWVNERAAMKYSTMIWGQKRGDEGMDGWISAVVNGVRQGQARYPIDRLCMKFSRMGVAACVIVLDRMNVNGR